MDDKTAPSKDTETVRKKKTSVDGGGGERRTDEDGTSLAWLVRCFVWVYSLICASSWSF